MKQYLLNILTLALCCGVLDLLAPAGERDGLRRGVRLLAGLCVLCLTIRPVATLRHTMDGLDLGAWFAAQEQTAQSEYEQLMAQKLTAVSREQLREQLAAHLCGTLGLPREEFSLTFDWSEDGAAAQPAQVWVTLHGGAILCDPRVVETAVESAVGCPCTVSVGRNP